MLDEASLLHWSNAVKYDIAYVLIDIPDQHLYNLGLSMSTSDASYGLRA